MDRIQRLVPAFDGGDDFVGVCGPTEWLGLALVVLSDELVDGGLKVGHGAEPTGASASIVSRKRMDP